MRELDACGIGFVADAEGRPSRAIVLAALEGLANVKHRGAVAADARTSDGTGLLTTIPDEIFGADTGVAMLFVRGDDPAPAIEQLLVDEGLELVDWRTPPTDDGALGDLATRTRPRIVQAVFRPTAETSAALEVLDRRPTDDPLFDAADEDLERRAFRLRRRIDAVTDGTYVASCSFRTLVHKGLVAADALGDFYTDLADPRFRAPLAIFHQRFSTNTLPTWERAQPFRMLCHNGEINTIDGNHNRMRSRSHLGTVAAGLGPEELFRPVLDPVGERLGVARRGRRAPRARRSQHEPRHGDAHPGGVGGDEGPRSRGPRLLRVPLSAHGALGRTGGRHLHRREAGRGHPRPQRPATSALRRVRGRTGGLCLGDGGGADERPRERRSRSTRPGPHARREPQLRDRAATTP